MSDYAHCIDCDEVINLDAETWYTDGNDTYCEQDSKEVAK